MADQKVSELTELSAPALEDLVYAVDDPSGTPVSNKLTLARLLGQALPSICEGRLTTESGVPVSPADRLAQGTLYFTPAGGNRVALFDGTRWKLYAFTERSLALAVTAGANYDVFLYDNAGTLTLELGAAWTTGTTRSAALATQDGIRVKSGAVTRRFLGTIRASGTNVIEDSRARRFVSNWAHRVPRAGQNAFTTNRTTASLTWAEVDPEIRCEFLTAGDDAIAVGAQGMMTNSATGSFCYVAVGFDGTTPATGTLAAAQQTGNTIPFGLDHVAGGLAEGYHYATLLGAVTGDTATFYGAALSGTTVVNRTALSLQVPG